jgi:hypothetical protein
MSVMVIVAIRAVGLEYLVKICDWGRSRCRYIFTDSDSTRPPPPPPPTPTPQPWSEEQNLRKEALSEMFRA